MYAVKNGLFIAYRQSDSFFCRNSPTVLFFFLVFPPPPVLTNAAGTRGARARRARKAIFEARPLFFSVVLRLQVEVALSRQQQERSVRGEWKWEGTLVDASCCLMEGWIDARI